MADAALGVAQWAVGKALDAVAEGMLGAWEASRQFGFNIEALKTELEQVRATLEIAATKKLPGPDTMKLLQKLQDSAHNAEDLLDELDYFRIHDELNGTYEAADQHAKGCVCDLVRDARHTAKAIGKQLASLCAYCFRANAGHHQQGDARQHVSRCAWQRARRRSPGDSSLVPNADQADPEVNGCMPKLGKLLPGSSSQYPHVRGDEDHDNAQETAMPVFNRSDFSRRMEGTVEQLNRVRNDVKDILQTCGPRIAPDIAQHRPTTTPQSAEPKLYGRDRVMKSIIHDITEGQYCDKGLTVLPVVGPGGMGKTTLIQHIYNNQQVQSHFPVRIWICVSLNFNLDKVLEEIKRYTPRVKGEEEHVRLEELIEQRLKCKRFLLVLDDIWQFTHLDDWKKLLLILGKSQEKGSMILVTTRFQAIAQEVKTTDHPKELNGLESEDFRKLFLVFIFDDGQCPMNKLHLLDKIMEKLKGSPLAAKTVGRLLRTDPSMGHWRRVLNSEEWGTDNNGIMSALKLSYDFLPFNLQRCFAYSGLFPEDYNFRSDELISLWIGLDILIPNGQNQTFEDIGLSNLNELVTHGFFREEETGYGLRYVMHDLLHDLALKVASHDCLSLRHDLALKVASHDCLSLRISDVVPMEIQPSIRHLSISRDDFGEYDAVSGEKLKSKLEELKTGFKVEHLQTLMLFGKMDEGFVKIFGDLFGEVNALRVLHLTSMVCPVESMLHHFSGLVHLRYLCLGTEERQMHLPLSISKFYHLRILDLTWWSGSCVLPDDMSNLAKLCHFYVPSDDHFYVALGVVQWVVTKALAPVADGVLEAWAASRNFGPNMEALRTELLFVQATLENAARKEIGGPAMGMLLEQLRNSAHNAEDLLDELDYFRIHGELHGTYDAADQHGEGSVHDLALSARHTAKAVGKQVNCCPWQRAKRRQRSRGDSSLAARTNQEVSGCMPKLGKLLPCSSSPNPHVGEEDRGNVQETPKPEFHRVDFSQKMKVVAEKLQLMRNEFSKILIHCGPRIAPDIAQHRPTTTPQSAEPKLYGRDRVMKSIIHDITEGQYCDKGLTVLPVVGPGGMGKTTLIQHIYNNQQVQSHFPVRIWICVSLNFNLDKVLEEIKRYTPRVKGEEEHVRLEELIEQRLKCKRFLLVLDDIWQITHLDDWKKLLLILSKSQEKGSMILVTTRIQAIAQEVKTTDHPKELNGLESEDFRKLFLVFIFDDGQCPTNKLHLLDKIMEKLKGSPLAAKTVGRLLRTDPSMGHWRRVLNSEEWGTNNNGIMSALKLSYDFLPFNLQQCFAYSGLFPEDYNFRSDELISLWIGLDILIPNGQNQTFEDIGLSNLNELVMHGFFRKEETKYGLRYVMHDLLHDLALKVSSHDCLSLRLSDFVPMEIQPSIRHLSISIYGLGEYDAVSGGKLKSKLEELKTRFKVEHLQTLMLFGKMDEVFVKIFGDFFGEVNALRVLHFPSMVCPVESMLHNFSGLVHLRYLCLGTKDEQMHLPLNISKFYHLRILDLEVWNGSCVLPDDMSNLAKLCHFYVPSDDHFHSDICNVGKLKLLEELKVFQVKKNSEGFEPKQLEHLTKLRELGMYNLEKIDTTEEAAQAKLMEKTYLRRLTLEWDSERSSVQPGVEAAVLESLQPHGDLQVLCIRGHRGPSCPTWLGDEFAVEALQSLYLCGVSWEVIPSLGKAWDLRELKLEDIARPKVFIIEKSFCMLTKLQLIGLGSFEKWVYPAEESSLSGDLLPLLQVLIIRECPKLLGLPFPNHIVSSDWFPKLQELEVIDCPEFSSVIPISWIESLCHVRMRNVKLLDIGKSSGRSTLEITGKSDLLSLDQVLVFDKEIGLEELTLESCPPLELKHLLMLTSLRRLTVENSVGLVGPLGGGQSDVEWQLPVECMRIYKLNGNTGEELTELLPHLPKLSCLEINNCKNLKKLVVGDDAQQTTQEASEMGGGEITAATEEEDDGDGVLLFPAHLCDSLQELELYGCPELVLVDPPTLVPGGRGGLQALRSLQRLTINNAPKFLSASLQFSCHLFPSSLQFLELWRVEGMGPLSNLSSLVTLELRDCGEDLNCQGLWSLLTTGGQLNKLVVMDSPRFFAGWDPNPRRALEDAEGGEEQQTQLVSSTLLKLRTDDPAGLLAAPVCRFLSSSLTKLKLLGDCCEGMERFTKEQEDALQLLSSLQKLEFWTFKDLQQLPAGLCNLTSLKILSVNLCPAVSSLPNDALPVSLEKLDVYGCSRKLKQYCRGLEGTIPEIKIL